MWAGLVPPEVEREVLFHALAPASGGLLAILGALWLVGVSLTISAFIVTWHSLFVSVPVSPFYKATVILV